MAGIDATTTGEKIDEDRLEDFAGVFSLIDRDGLGHIPPAALSQALQGSGFMDKLSADGLAAEQGEAAAAANATAPGADHERWV